MTDKRRGWLYLKKAPKIPNDNILVPKGTRYYLTGVMPDACVGCVCRCNYHYCFVSSTRCKIKAIYASGDDNIPTVPYENLEGFQRSEKTVDGDTLLIFSRGASFVIHGEKIENIIEI